MIKKCNCSCAQLRNCSTHHHTLHVACDVGGWLYDVAPRRRNSDGTAYNSSKRSAHAPATVRDAGCVAQAVAWSTRCLRDIDCAATLCCCWRRAEMGYAKGRTDWAKLHLSSGRRRASRAHHLSTDVDPLLPTTSQSCCCIPPPPPCIDAPAKLYATRAWTRTLHHLTERHHAPSVDCTTTRLLLALQCKCHRTHAPSPLPQLSCCSHSGAGATTLSTAGRQAVRRPTRPTLIVWPRLGSSSPTSTPRLLCAPRHAQGS